MDDINAKLASITAYCTSEAASCGANEAATVTFHSNKVAELQNAISNYMASQLNVLSWESDLRTIILELYQYETMQGLSTDVPLYTYGDFASPPEAFNDVRKAFSGGGVLSELLSRPDSDFYLGCLSAPVGSHPLIDGMITSLNGNVYQIDASARAELIGYLKRVNSYNTFVFLFEEIVTTQGVLEKSDTAGKIYTDKHVLDVINAYNLDVYIPTYLR